MLYEKVIKEPEGIVFISTTCSSRDEARILGLKAIREKLAISIDYWLIESIYPWHDVIQEVDQYMVVFSTKKLLGNTLMKFIEKEHPYVTPMISRSDASETNSSYNFWVYNTLEKKSEYKTWSEDQKEKEREDEGGYHFGKLK